MAKKKSFNTLVLEMTIKDLHLSRLEASIFYRLLGFLLRDDNSFIYTAEKLAEKTLYKRRSIFDALKSLEKKKLITRTGFSYQRRFSKGLTLVEICTQVQKLHGEDLYTSAEPALPSAEPALPSAKTAYNKTAVNVSKHLGDLTQKFKIQKPKPQNQHPPLTEEQIQILGDFKHGLKYPQMQLTGLKFQLAEHLYRRECPDYQCHG